MMSPGSGDARDDDLEEPTAALGRVSFKRARSDSDVSEGSIGEGSIVDGTSARLPARRDDGALAGSIATGADWVAPAAKRPRAESRAGAAAAAAGGVTEPGTGGVVEHADWWERCHGALTHVADPRGFDIGVDAAIAKASMQRPRLLSHDPSGNPATSIVSAFAGSACPRPGIVHDDGSAAGGAGGNDSGGMPLAPGGSERSAGLWLEEVGVGERAYSATVGSVPWMPLPQRRGRRRQRRGAAAQSGSEMQAQRGIPAHAVEDDRMHDDS